jgi:uncharacterized membrane protein
MKLFLSVSLLVNVIVISIVLGWGIRHSFFRHDKQPPHKMEQALTKGLPADIAEQVYTQLDVFHEGRKNLRRQFLQNRKKINAMLAADNFDLEAFLKALEENRQSRDNVMDSLTQQLGEIAVLLPKEKRKILARFIARGPSGDRRHKRPHHHKNSTPLLLPKDRK